jgi:hypothetical protein
MRLLRDPTLERDGFARTRFDALLAREFHSSQKQIDTRRGPQVRLRRRRTIRIRISWMGRFWW